MKGRTRSFIEDFVVLIVVAILLILAYNFFISEDEEVPKNNIEKTTIEKEVVENNEPMVKQEKQEKQEDSQEKTSTEKSQKEQNSSSIEVETIQAQQLKEDKTLKPKIEEINEANEIEEPKKELKEEVNVKAVDPQKIAQFVQKIDIRALKEFKEETKKKMKESISFDESTTKPTELKIRITVLKNGDYEQLTYVGGDKELFKINQENITSIFPLEIIPSIAGDFPRYLRYTFKFDSLTSE